MEYGNGDRVVPAYSVDLAIIDLDEAFRHAIGGPPNPQSGDRSDAAR